MHIPQVTISAFTKKSNGTEELVMTGSVDACSDLPENQFVVTSLHVDTAQVFVSGSLLHWISAGERPEFGIKLPLGA